MDSSRATFVRDKVIFVREKVIFAREMGVKRAPNAIGTPAGCSFGAGCCRL